MKFCDLMVPWERLGRESCGSRALGHGMGGPGQKMEWKIPSGQKIGGRSGGREGATELGLEPLDGWRE